MRILIAGDFCPHDRVAKALHINNYATLVDKSIQACIRESSYSILNLECPVVDSSSVPIKKIGPNLGFSERSIDAVGHLGFDCVTLANNHFLDYGESAVKYTIDILNDNNIDHVGGGENFFEASQILTKNLEGTCFSIINCCEREFSIAHKNEAGSNPIDIIDLSYRIKEIRKKTDYIIVIIHGGIENYPYPTERMVRMYRFLIDMGADVILNHHQHCFSGYEIYKGKPIFYGLGNFCFDWNGKRKALWNSGYMVSLEFNKGTLSYNIIPYIQCDKDPLVREMTIEEREKFDKNITEINKIISDEEILHKTWTSYLSKNRKGYFWPFEPYRGKILQKAYFRGILPSLLSHKQKLHIMNLIRCESHRDNLLSILNEE